MINISVKQLRYFDALARRLHFGRAADDCAVTQPALSVQIKELEQTLGAPLVERGGRHIRLTPLGETIATRAAAILTALRELEDTARAARAPMTGRLRLGVIPTIAPYLLPGLIGRIGALYPALDLFPREATTAQLLAALDEGALDAAILALPVHEPTLTERPLFDEEFLLVRPAEDAGSPVPGAEGLRRMRLLLLEEGHCFRDQALDYCGTHAPRELIEGSALSTLVQMVGAGIGVTLIPEMAVRLEARATPVDVARLPAPRPARTIGMVWRRSSPLTSDLTCVADEILALRAATAGPSDTISPSAPHGAPAGKPG